MLVRAVFYCPNELCWVHFILPVCRNISVFVVLSLFPSIFLSPLDSPSHASLWYCQRNQAFNVNAFNLLSSELLNYFSSQSLITFLSILLKNQTLTVNLLTVVFETVCPYRLTFYACTRCVCICCLVTRCAAETAERHREHKFSGISVRRVHCPQFTGRRTRGATSRAPAWCPGLQDMGVRWRPVWRADLPVHLCGDVSQSTLSVACDAVLHQQRVLQRRAEWRPGSPVSSRHCLLSARLSPAWA